MDKGARGKVTVHPSHPVFPPNAMEGHPFGQRSIKESELGL